MDELRTDYKDQLLDTNVNTERRYNLVDSDGNIVQSGVSLRDVTVYSQEGDSFGAGVLNGITGKINDLNDSLANGEISFSVVDGIPYVKAGADSPRPFNNGKNLGRKPEKSSGYSEYIFALIYYGNYTKDPTVTPTFGESGGATTVLDSESYLTGGTFYINSRLVSVKPKKISEEIKFAYANCDVAWAVGL